MDRTHLTRKGAVTTMCLKQKLSNHQLHNECIWLVAITCSLTYSMELVTHGKHTSRMSSNSYQQLLHIWCQWLRELPPTNIPNLNHQTKMTFVRENEMNSENSFDGLHPRALEWHSITKTCSQNTMSNQLDEQNGKREGKQTIVKARHWNVSLRPIMSLRTVLMTNLRKSWFSFSRHDVTI